MWGEANWVMQLGARGIEPETAAIVILVLVAAFSWIGKWLKNGERPVVLIREGQVDGAVLRRCGVSDEALHEAMERQGMRAFADVERGYVDHDGVIVLVPRRALLA
jgi:uncharacterized membrane protein YcaP (DUF421 family)